MSEVDRITFDPNVMGGKVCIRGMRVTVSLVLNLIANGMRSEEIVEAYPISNRKMFVGHFNTQNGWRAECQAPFEEKNGGPHEHGPPDWS
jgi:hypothetical protein